MPFKGSASTSKSGSTFEWDVRAQSQTLKDIVYEPNEATAEAFLLPPEALPYSS